MRNFIKNIFLFVFIFLMALNANSQSYELGLGVGAGNYSGDVRQYNFMENALGFNFFVRYNHSDAFSFRGGFTFTGVKGSDQLSNDPVPKLRNYEFSNQILELSAITEYNFLNFRDGKNVFTPYFMGGIGFFRYNTITSSGDISAGNYTVSIPFGMGIKYAISRNINCSIELGARDTFTDMIDGINNDNNPRLPGTNHFTDDWYYYTSISFTYLFHNIDCPDNSPVLHEKPMHERIQHRNNKKLQKKKHEGKSNKGNK